MANPYQAQIEALQAGGSQEIENARKLLDMTKHMPDTGLALADMLKRNAESMAEQIPVDDSVIQMIDQFARHQQTFAQDMDEIDAQVRKAHEVQIRNIEEPRPNAEKWDVAANRD